MNVKQKNTYMAIACVLLIVVGGLYYFNKDETAPPRAVEDTVTDPASMVTFSGNTIVEHLNGKKAWEISAETIQVDPKTNMVRLLNLKGTIYRDKGDKIDIVAQSAELDPKTKNLTMEGGITATASDGAVFQAPKCRWDSQAKMFYGTGGIRLTREDTVITGEQIETDANMEKTKVQGNAHIVKGGS